MKKSPQQIGLIAFIKMQHWLRIIRSLLFVLNPIVYLTCHMVLYEYNQHLKEENKNRQIRSGN